VYSPEELTRLWRPLSSRDGEAAWRAAAALARSPDQAVALVRKRLPITTDEHMAASRQLIQRLDHPEFETREQARLALEKLAEHAEPALRDALEQALTLEARRRVEQILAKLEFQLPSARSLQAQRVMALLEVLGTYAADDMIQELARGMPHARLTEDAKAVLSRHGPHD
jgi:hypothetical protein